VILAKYLRSEKEKLMNSVSGSGRLEYSSRASSSTVAVS